MEKLERIRDLFVLFIFFAVCGWIYEVVLTVIAYGYFENRGFLFGPWLPIYGFGGLVLYLVFGGLLKKDIPLYISLPLVFVCICLLASVIELAASYLLDTVGIGFSTLWNYYGEFMEFEGRISLVSSLRFGAVGAAALYLGVPLCERFCGIRNVKLLNTVCTVTAALFLIDLAARIPFGSNL